MVMEAKAENEMNQSQLNSKQKRETRQKARENAHERHDWFWFFSWLVKKRTCALIGQKLTSALID